MEDSKDQIEDPKIEDTSVVDAKKVLEQKGLKTYQIGGKGSQRRIKKFIVNHEMVEFRKEFPQGIEGYDIHHSKTEVIFEKSAFQGTETMYKKAMQKRQLEDYIEQCQKKGKKVIFQEEKEVEPTQENNQFKVGSSYHHQIDWNRYNQQELKVDQEDEESEEEHEYISDTESDKSGPPNVAQEQSSDSYEDVDSQDQDDEYYDQFVGDIDENDEIAANQDQIDIIQEFLRFQEESKKLESKFCSHTQDQDHIDKYDDLEEGDIEELDLDEDELLEMQKDQIEAEEEKGL